MFSANAPALHLIIPTHTTRHLDLCLTGIALQTVRPATITVTCDVDDVAIGTMLQEQAAKLRLRIHYVRRQGEGKERLAQVRNNAVRALESLGVNSGRLLFLDGDTYATSNCVALHQELGSRAEMVLPGRINLTEAETELLHQEALLAGTQLIGVSPAHLGELDSLQRRGDWHQFLRRLKFTKSHKPKLLGGHHSVDWDAFLQVNGHDEEYHTWGTEDDDFARRVYQTGGRSIVAVRRIVVFHLYHPPRGGGDWHDRANAERFASTGLPTFCRFGLRDPWPQSKVELDIFGG